jgi:hypothetical protein
MSENLNIYNAVRQVPPTALKEIQAGRLKGKSDINPMWRIRALTEQFGPCGVGWKYAIVDERLEKGGNDEIAAFVRINLYYKWNGEWSEAIPGTGGSSFVAKEKNGMFTSDECFKMALTDAISVACKALGFAADVYWDKDKTKYSNASPEPKTTNPDAITESQRTRLFAIGTGKTKEVKEILLKYGYTSSNEIKKKDYEAICNDIEKLNKEAS